MRLIQTQNKILLTLSVTTLLPFVLIATFLFFKKQNVSDEILVQYGKLKKENFRTALETSGLHLQAAAQAFAMNRVVQDYYQQNYSDTLRSLKKMRDVFAQAMGQPISISTTKSVSPYDIQLFVPPAKNIYKSWIESTGEDASLLRKSILHVNAFQKATWAFELGRSGIEVRGIAPVYSNNHQLYMGTLELVGRLRSILDALSSQNEVWAVYTLDRNYRLISPASKSHSSDFHRVGRYVFAQGKALEFNSTLYNEAELDKIMSSEDEYLHIAYRGEKWNYGFPIQDFSGKTIAIATFQVKQTMLETIVPDFIEEAMVFIIIILSLFIFFLSRYLGATVSIAGTIVDLPRFFFQFSEIKTLRVQVQRYSAELKELQKAMESFFMQKGTTTISSSNRLHKAWDLFRSDFIAENERIVQLRDELSEQEWLSQSRRDIDTVLYQRYDSISSLMDAVLRKYIDLLGVQAGVIYFVDEPQAQVIPMATYVAKRNVAQFEPIPFGEGIVGTMVVEKKRKLIENIPENYFSITSGLGHSAPRQIIIEPLMSQGNVLAILELATISGFSIKGLELLNSTSELVAVRLGIFNITQEAKGLVESSKQKDIKIDEDKAVIEKLEESLLLLQRDMEVVEAQLSHKELIMDEGALYMQYNKNGFVVEASKQWTEVTGLSHSEIIGSSFYDGIDFDKFEYTKQKDFWDTLADGNIHQRIMSYHFNGKDHTVREMYLAELDRDEIISVTKVAFAIE